MKLQQLPTILRRRYVTPLLLEKQYGNVLAKNRILKDTKKGKRCFILGTGPSISNQDILRLKNEDTFVVSTFWKHPDYGALNPTYYCVFDSYNFPNDEGRGSALVQDLVDRDNVVSAVANTKLFYNVVGKDFIDRQKLFQKNETFYLGFHGFFPNNLKFNIEIDRLVPNIKNIIIGCLLTAVYLGYEEIYLLGCEHSFLAYPSYKHYDGFKFFHEMKMDVTNPEHVKKYALDIMPYERHIDHTKILFKNYRLLKEKLSHEKPNVKIFNATPGSFLDVFPFVQYEDIAL